MLPEVCICGRSNVGKSSLINALTNRKQLARASSTPGRTRLINFFNIQDQLMLVDLPGYGWAKVPKPMAVPAHDERDWEFAKTFDLPIIPVLAMPDGSAPDISEAAYTDEGKAINSGQFDGLTTAEFKAAITEWLTDKGLGEKAVNYRLRDWLFSRQRYWGEPFPMIHLEDGSTKPLPLDALPLTLPEVETYQPSGTGESPLATIEEWVNTTDPATGAAALRETNTMG